ncbi:MAG: hypothetical protein H7326_10740, partial [Bdellovibrionaceae bacterium]|nr:hypothetical protein [Pseudobdellovibrionaceae bacterium]
MEKAKKNEPIYLGPETPKSGRFMTLSVLIHASMLATVTLMTIPKYETPIREVVEFEVASDTIGPKPIADGTAVPESKGAAEELPAAPEVKAAAAPIAAPKVEVAQPAPESVPVAPKAAVVAPTIVKSNPVQAAPPVKAAPASKANTIDDIKTPDLETSDDGDVPVAKLEDNDLNDDFEKVDNDHNNKLKAVQKNLDDEAEKEAAENAAAVAAAEKQNR